MNLVHHCNYILYRFQLKGPSSAHPIPPRERRNGSEKEQSGGRVTFSQEEKEEEGI